MANGVQSPVSIELGRMKNEDYDDDDSDEMTSSRPAYDTSSFLPNSPSPCTSRTYQVRCGGIGTKL